MDGSFFARVTLNRAAPADTHVLAQLFDAAGKPYGSPLDSGVIKGDTPSVRGQFDSPALWAAETPNRYSAKISLAGAAGQLHKLEQHFGFRTLEVRANDGVYLNGHRIVLQGSNMNGEKPILEPPDMGWSFLHAIPSIGTKFAPAEVLGPQSQPRNFDGVIHGELLIDVAARVPIKTQ